MIAAPEIRDEQIQDEILARLWGEGRGYREDVEVEVHDGVVTLTGVVPTPETQFRAEYAALSTEGVRAVADDLLLGPHWSMVDDTSVAEAIAGAIDQTGNIPAGCVHPCVRTGDVVLRGMVYNQAQKEAAVSAVRQTPGVHHVADLLEIEDPETDGLWALSPSGVGRD